MRDRRIVMARIRKQAQKEMADLMGDIKWSIAIYIRLSREDGHDESLSITQQRKMKAILMVYMK